MRIPNEASDSSRSQSDNESSPKSKVNQVPGSHDWNSNDVRKPPNQRDRIHYSQKLADAVADHDFGNEQFGSVYSEFGLISI